jgi:hypothetical protein
MAVPNRHRLTRVWIPIFIECAEIGLKQRKIRRTDRNLSVRRSIYRLLFLESAALAASTPTAVAGF